MHTALFALWFLLPAGLANVTPIVLAKLPLLRGWDWPLDCGRTFRGRPLLGSHKTWRGVIGGMIVSTLVFWLQVYAYNHTTWGKNWSSQIDYASLPVLLIGPLFGLGALGGDALKSFFKRQVGHASGEPWIPFDQLDYIIGALLVTAPFVSLGFGQYVWVFVIWLGMHLLASYAGWLIGFKERPI
jgi:CDP-2,3-bis-(O-geranylgeranyl)-sn-glycerol synthase